MVRRVRNFFGAASTSGLTPLSPLFIDSRRLRWEMSEQQATLECGNEWYGWVWEEWCRVRQSIGGRYENVGVGQTMNETL